MPVVEAAPAGTLPFRLCGKPLVQPGAVGEGVRPGHVKNWVIQPTQTQGIYKKKLKRVFPVFKSQTLSCCTSYYQYEKGYYK